MAFLANDIFDSGLNVLNTATTTIYITSQEATTRTEATATYDLGNVAVSIPAAVDRTASGGGRKVAVPAVTTGSVTDTGTASHYAIVDGTRLLVTGALSASQAVTSGNSFSLATFDIGIPDPS
jgi:hypothetical protein